MDAKERIKQAALREFAQYGYDGARLERIARAAGVHTAQIHYYFRNKRGLYEAVQGEIAPASLDNVIQPLRTADKPLPERIQAFYERLHEALQRISLPTAGMASSLVPPLLLSPEPLRVPEWIEALRSAQSFGLLKPLRIEFILTHQWGVGLLPVWFGLPSEEWASYYTVEAPRLFWEAVKAV